MSVHLIFWKLELKRAFLRFPQMVAGATVLLFLASAVALLASRALYDDAAVGRVAVGVVMPEDDLLARQMVTMVSSLDSVKSICDFQYIERPEGLKKLQAGELYAVMDMPEGLLQGIMDGSNPSVRILFPSDAGPESRIFRELTEAGARTLSAAQAGIYGGNELCRRLGREGEIPEMERELNEIFLSYSLPREHYFRHMLVKATGDVETKIFYAISVFVLFLLLLAIPASDYLLPFSPVMKKKLKLAGIGGMSRAAGRIAGLGSLFFAVSLLMGVVACGVKECFFAAAGYGELSSLITGWPMLLLVCLAAASFVSVLYQIAGSLLGGTMLLVLAATAQHFLAGGFLPAVFLPSVLQKLAPVMPSAILIDGIKVILTADWELMACGKVLLLLAVGFVLTAVMEGRET